MRLNLLIFTLFLLPLFVVAQSKKDITISMLTGNDSVSSAFFRDQYLHNNFAHYLDNYSDLVTYQTETTGDFQLPDLQLFSISGNSYQWNKYYLNGFRVDNRFFPGNSYYTPDLYNHNLIIDSYDTQLLFESDLKIDNSFSFRYNIGGLGGISPLTEELVNLYHPTASQRLYKPIEYRRNMKQAGSVYLNYNIKSNKQNYTQQLYVDFGTRNLVGFDFGGINSYYPEDFFRLQLNGALPLKVGELFDEINYLINTSSRQNLFTEVNFARNESAQYQNHQASIYGSATKDDLQYTTGITSSIHSLRHNDINFSRNLIDQDGEAFEPWYPDGSTLELSHSIFLKKQLKQHLSFEFDGYNSLLKFTPFVNDFIQSAYVENINFPYHSLYAYKWSSKQFASGLFENSLRLNFDKQVNQNWQIIANADATLDGMVLKQKTMIKANWQAQLNFLYQPNNHFSLALNFGRKRIAFNYDHIRFFSNDYLNGEVNYWVDANNDKLFQSDEMDELLTTTGGLYHGIQNGLKQPAYFIFEFPLEYTLGKHKFSMFNTYKKYSNQWTVQFEGAAEDFGDFSQVNYQPIYFLNNGPAYYEVQHYPEEYFSEATFLRMASNSPYYLSNTVKYAFNSEKITFSVAWTSYILTGVSALGNGPLQNNLGVLSESSANPNSRYKLIGRLDQDRALAARILLAYQINNEWKIALSGKFKDGQPFTNFNTALQTNEKNQQQLAIWNKRTKGINPFTHEFGSRDDAFFNTEIRISYSNRIGNMPFDIQLMAYNIYDFGTELVEYSFQPDETNSRYAMELNIPRGLICTAKFYFN